MDFLQEMGRVDVRREGITWLALSQPHELIISGPVLLLWLASPVVAWWISRPLVADKPVLSDTQHTFLRGLARQTWRYFEVLVNAEENWLPPDNFQEVPEPVVASRTSPTNIGMALLANLVYDFGFLSAGQPFDRTDKTSHDRAARTIPGSFYNWRHAHLKPLPALRRVSIAAI
jgi:hypothetical protein